MRKNATQCYSSGGCFKKTCTHHLTRNRNNSESPQAEWAWEEMYWCGHSAVLQEASLRLSHRRLACKVPVEGN